MADYDFQTLMNAASAADKAGDTEGARTLINAARALQTEDVSLLDRTLNAAKRTGTVIADVGEGLGAGVIGAGQGVSELVAMPVDYVFNTDLGSGITEFFEETKEDLGLTPETGVGKFAEGVGTLLPAMIPLVDEWCPKSGFRNKLLRTFRLLWKKRRRVCGKESKSGKKISWK